MDLMEQQVNGEDAAMRKRAEALEEALTTSTMMAKKPVKKPNSTVRPSQNSIESCRPRLMRRHSRASWR